MDNLKKMINNEELVNDYFKEHKLFSETYKTACVEILQRLQKELKQVKNINYDALLGIIDLNGYTKHFYGYRKITNKHTHWITMYSDSIQMYCYRTDDKDMDKVYDTGIVNIDDRQLQHLIDVWLLNYA